MSGYTEDEKLRLQQLRALRRRWLRDQELSEREPVLPPRRLGPVAAFWERFLQPGGFWRHQVSGGRGQRPRTTPPTPGPDARPCAPQVFKACQTGSFVLTRILIPSWIIVYFVKYHVMKKPHGVIMSNPRIFPGDRILETGEIMPPLKDEPSEHH
ncbi:NDUB6 dehydrogenase, partial [Glaucidium brasilianum]|nr:NDUB6 dehydrogenase [Glaucidium brasilianum]